MKPPRWVCFELLMALLLVAWPWGARAADAGLRLDPAEFVLSEDAGPPPDSAPWQTVALPDAWWRSRPGVVGTGWYRLSWPVEAIPLQPQAMYLPKFGRVGAAFVNGRLIGASASVDRPELISRPQLFIVDPTLLHEGVNTVHLRMQTTALFNGVMSAPQVGEPARLRPIYEWRYFAAVTGPQLLFGVTLVLGMFMLVLASKRRGERTLGYFGIASLMYALNLLDWVVIVAPCDLVWWTWNYGLGTQGTNVATTVFALRYGGWALPRLEAALWATVPLVIAGEGLSTFGIELPVDVSILQWEMIVTYIGVFAAIAWRMRSAQSVALLLVSPGCLLDGMASINGLPADTVSLFPYSFLLLFMLIGWILVNRFAQSLGEAERLNIELEERVENKRVELEHNYQKLRTLEQQQAVAEERRRIMSDMHDGIGGQLISTLGLVEHGSASKEQVAAALRECIDDIRLTIDSLEPADQELLPLLGNLRYRLEARLRQQGIALDWQVSEVPKLGCLTPQNLLHILRILQEAFTNILKHAHANRISVGTVVEAGHVSIRIADNGQGFGAVSGAPGRGLANMLDRARRIGGDLKIQASSSGTTLSLLLPIS